MIMNSMLADVCDVDELNIGPSAPGVLRGRVRHLRQDCHGRGDVPARVPADRLAFRARRGGAEAPGTIAFWLKALLFTQPTGFLLGVVCLLFYTITRAPPGSPPAVGPTGGRRIALREDRQINDCRKMPATPASLPGR